jgi:hypothetical protein
MEQIVRLPLLEPGRDVLHLTRDLPHQLAGDAGVAELIRNLRHSVQLLRDPAEPTRCLLLAGAGLVPDLVTGLVEQVARLAASLFGHSPRLLGRRPDDLATCLLN